MTFANCVLDTSVAIAWYVPESFSASARRWQKSLLRGEITMSVPSLHYLEMANVLRTYVRRAEFDAETAEEIYRLHLLAPIEVIEPARETILETAFSHDCTSYDAAYVALALELDLALVTAERTTTPWVAKLKSRARIVAG